MSFRSFKERFSTGCFIWTGLAIVLLFALFCLNTYQSCFLEKDQAPEIYKVEIPKRAVTSMVDKWTNACRTVLTCDSRIETRRVKLKFDEDETNALLTMFCKTISNEKNIHKGLNERLHRILPQYGITWNIYYQNQEFFIQFNADNTNMPEWKFVGEKKVLPLLVSISPTESDDAFTATINSARAGRLPLPGFMTRKFDPIINDIIENATTTYPKLPQSVKFYVDEEGNFVIDFSPGMLAKIPEFYAMCQAQFETPEKTETKPADEAKK